MMLTVAQEKAINNLEYWRNRGNNFEIARALIAYAETMQQDPAYVQEKLMASIAYSLVEITKNLERIADRMEGD